MILVFVSFFYVEPKIDLNALHENDHKNNTT